MKFYWNALTNDGIRVLFDGKAPDQQIDNQLFSTSVFERRVNRWLLITY